jgi:hypothetical protein
MWPYPQPHERCDRDDRAEDALPESDDEQQPVALRDVVRMPGSSAVASLGQERSDQLDPDEEE